VNLGIVLLVLAALGSGALVGVLLGVSSDGSLAVVGLGAMSPPGTAVVVALVALATSVLFFLGLHLVLRERRQRGWVMRQDRIATDAEREARARLLAMRLEQLETELEILEGRRQAVLHRSTSSVGPSWRLVTEPKPDLVVLPDPD
jgi:hypothetical protein